MRHTATAVLLLAALASAGCSGLQTAWRLQLEMRYVTPEDKPDAAPAKPAAPGAPA